MPEKYTLKIPKKNKAILLKIFNEFLYFIYVYITYVFTVRLFKSFQNLQDKDYFFLLSKASQFQLQFMIPLHLFYVSLYYFKFPFFEKFRCNNMPWSWELKNSNFTLKKQILVYVSNLLLSFLLTFTISKFITVNPNFIDENIPSFSFVLLWIFCNTFIEDFFFYWGHRFLHQEFIYKYIHKQHHEAVNTIHINCIYTHPVEFVIGNLFPSYAGWFMFPNQTHFITNTIWILIRFIKTHIGHGGYDFPINFVGFNYIQKAGTTYHNYHHLKNAGNYSGGFEFWDNIFGTSVPYKQEEKKQLKQ